MPGPSSRRRRRLLGRIGPICAECVTYQPPNEEDLLIRTKLAAVAVAATALAAGPLTAAPAAASETHVCEVFADPYATVCALPLRVYCWIFPTQTICH